MDKIIIVGGYEFLSFHLCAQFLEQGYAVECICFDNRDDLFLEEKMFSVGRNSNLVERTLDEWIEAGLTCEEESLVIVSLFDLFLKKNAEQMLLQLENAAQKLADVKQFKPMQVVFLQPLSNQPVERNLLGNLHEKLANLVGDKGIRHDTISLPTLYGPWQPVEFSFQQALYNEVKRSGDFLFHNEEWTDDAIYIDDAVRELVRQINEAKLETCTFKNKREEQWHKCAGYLEINSDFYRNSETMGEEATNVIYREISESIDYEQGLLMQKQHLIRFFEGV